MDENKKPPPSYLSIGFPAISARKMGWFQNKKCYFRRVRTQGIHIISLDMYIYTYIYTNMYIMYIYVWVYVVCNCVYIQYTVYSIYIWSWSCICIVHIIYIMNNKKYQMYVYIYMFNILYIHISCRVYLYICVCDCVCNKGNRQQNFEWVNISEVRMQHTHIICLPLTTKCPWWTNYKSGTHWTN